MPFYGAYKALGHYPDYWYWKLRGEPVRSPHLIKQRTVREYARQYGLRTLIETGTYYGEMVAAVKSEFERVYSIEFDPELARRAARRFASDPRVHILEGDSQRLLPELLKSILEPSLFWLDAGYWGWANLARDPQRLSAEVEAALSHAVKGHVVLMDDARMLDGRNGAPTYDELRARIAARFPGRRVQLQHDIIRITPS
jgi:predicted O-methyltransferase YrrM